MISNDDLIGRVFGKVRLEQILGEGQTGIVFRGRHLTLDKNVAVKILKQTSVGSDRKFNERFKREARVAASIDDPSVVRVIDYGEEHELLYLVMDFIDGYPLSRYMRNKPDGVDEPTALKILLAIGRSLYVAHGKGIIHRDVKPDNILLSRKGSLHLADLGLAKGEGMGDLTQARYVVGSPAYMAPETVNPDLDVDHRADLYALGVIGYQLMYGTLPYRGTIEELLQASRAGGADFSKPTTFQKKTVGVIRRLMSVTREERYQNARELIEDLRPLLSTTIRRDRRTRGEGTGEATGTGSRGSSSEFAGMVRFMESTLGSHTSTHRGGQVTHTTSRERLLVWLLLIGFLGMAAAGWYYSTQSDKVDANVPTEPAVEQPDDPPAGPSAPKAGTVDE